MRARTIKNGILAAVLAASALTVSARADAAVPQGITHQGRLFDAENKPVSETLQVKFSLYDSSSATTPIWTEVHEVAFEDGYFSVRLGETVPFGGKMLESSAFYLGITIGDDKELSPRSQVGSVPFALVCGEVQGHIHPQAISIGSVEVIDANGKWVGDPTGLLGPAGPAGPEGAAGAEGPAGEQGPEGPAGADGAVGPMGPAGADGAMGPMGPAGADGAVGPMGPAGADGAMGPMGPQGPPGPAWPERRGRRDGPDGSAGPPGAMGCRRVA
jgi:hypothetical protein